MPINNKDMDHILCIEDSEEVQLVLKRALGPSFKIVFAASLEQARKELNHSKFDLLILDIGLPDGDGLRFCAELKSAKELAKLPVFILTSNNSMQEKTLGFQLGIEDFIVKPFEPLELQLRISSRLKKIKDQEKANECLSLGNLTIDLSTQRVSLTNGNGYIDLSTTEFKILTFLAKTPDQVKSREQIIANVWRDGLHLSDRTIDSHISRIRKKIVECDHKIEAVLNTGYRITPANNLKKSA